MKGVFHMHALNLSCLTIHNTKQSYCLETWLVVSTSISYILMKILTTNLVYQVHVWKTTFVNSFTS